MTKEILRQEFQRLLDPRTPDVCVELIGMHTDFMLRASKAHQYQGNLNIDLMHGKLFLQIMMSKLATISGLIKGITIQSNNGDIIDNHRDFIALNTLVRNLFETASVFHLIYFTPQSDDERQIIYNLWAISGLNYRQGFKASIRTLDNQQKQQHENKEIELLKQEIRKNTVYLSLKDKDRLKIETRIVKKDYLIRFEGIQVKCFKWSDVIEVFAIKDEKLLRDCYAFLSLSAHPSFVSVFQWGQGFSDPQLGPLGLCALPVRICFSFISFFLSDFLHAFPLYRLTYDSLPILNQITLQGPTILLRGESSKINDAYREMD